MVNFTITCSKGHFVLRINFSIIEVPQRTDMAKELMQKRSGRQPQSSGYQTDEVEEWAESDANVVSSQKEVILTMHTVTYIFTWVSARLVPAHTRMHIYI